MRLIDIIGNLGARLINSKTSVFLLFLVSVFILKYPTLDSPFFMDEKFWNVPAAFWIAQHNFYPVLGKGLPRELQIDHPLHPWLNKDIGDPAHPPLNYVFLAIIYTIFGCCRTAFHSAFLFIGVLTMYYTYLLGRRLMDSHAGFFSALLLLFSPLFFAQLPQCNDDMLLMLFSIITIYEYHSGRRLGYIFSGSCLALSKETGSLILLVILIHAAVKNGGWGMVLQGRLKGLIKRRQLYLYAIPFLFYFIWLLWHFHDKGSALNTNRAYSHSIAEYCNELRYVAKFVFLSQGRFLLLPGLLYLVTVGWRRVPVPQRQTVGLCLVLVLVLTALHASFDVFWHMRHFLPIFPFLFIIGALSARLLFEKAAYCTIAIAITCVVFSLFWHLNPNPPETQEASMYYWDVLQTRKAAAAFLQNQFPNRKIWVDEYCYADFGYPYVGYVNQPLNVALIPSPDFEIKYEPGNLIIESRYEWSWYENNRLHERIGTLPKTLVKNFRIGHEYLNIYMLQ